MATSRLSMNAELLSDLQINYELRIRGLFKPTDAYERRRKIFQKALEIEENNENAPIFDLSLEVASENIEAVEKDFGALVSRRNKDALCIASNVEFLET